MVTVRLERVHKVRSKGRVYYYAWRGGPRLPGAPGSPEFVSAYHEAHRDRKRPSSGRLSDAITTYKASAAYEALSDATKRAYGAHLDLIKAEFGDAPFKVLGDRRFRADALDWRDTMRKTPRQADYAMGTFKRLLDHAKDRGHLEANVLEDVKRLYKGNRADSIWTVEDIEAFNRVASKELQWALALALATALRQSDLISLPWGACDANSVTLRTQKSDKRVVIPLTLAGRKTLASIEKRHLIVLTNGRGKLPWTADGLRSSFRKACEKAGVKRTFHDLRRTAATTLLAAGIDKPQVAMIMGWSQDEVEALQRLYVSRQEVINAVLAKLEKAL